jgi:O-antigen ligase
VPLILLLILLNLGYAAAMLQVVDQSKVVTWVLISAYLAATAIVYAAMLGANTQARLAYLMRGTLAAGLVASLVAIAAYFHAFGSLSDLFLLYGRARGTFNDPNVLGAFLVLPALIALQRVLAGRLSAAFGGGVILLVMLAALLLSFSRAAWGQFAIAALLLMGMTFATSRAPSERLRIVLIAMGGALVALFLLAALLSIGQIADLFKERATLDQNYDLGHLGRFGRYILGFDLMLDRPLGIGPLQFSKSYFSEDPHNTFLNTFMSGGWLGGLAYLALTLVTAVRGLRFVFVRTPWQPTYHVIYAAFLGVAGESAIIDIDHWRHYFLILGVLWGLMAVTTPGRRLTIPALNRSP